MEPVTDSSEPRSTVPRSPHSEPPHLRCGRRCPMYQTGYGHGGRPLGHRSDPSRSGAPYSVSAAALACRPLIVHRFSRHRSGSKARRRAQRLGTPTGAGAPSCPGILNSSKNPSPRIQKFVDATKSLVGIVTRAGTPVKALEGPWGNHVLAGSRHRAHLESDAKVTHELTFRPRALSGSSNRRTRHPARQDRSVSGMGYGRKWDPGPMHPERVLRMECR